MPNLPQWFNSFFDRTPEPEPIQYCKIYVFFGRGAPIVVEPTYGMTEEEFRQLNGPLVFTRSEVVSGGDTTMSASGLLRVDFRVVPRAVWEPL